MVSISKIISLIVAFTLGFSVGAGAVVGGASIFLANLTIRDLERKGIPIPDESFIGENPEKDILDISALEWIDEFEYLQDTFGDDLCINDLQGRYAIIFNETLDGLLSDETREMPIKQLLSKDGVMMLLSTVYIGNVEKYECRIDTEDGGYEISNPKVEGSYWVTSEGKKVSPIEQEIANWTLATFMSGGINTDTLLHQFTVGELLGYTKGEDGEWYNAEDVKATGVVRAIAGSQFDTIGDHINDLIVGDLLGYEKKDDGWYETDDDGVEKKVSGVMAVFADSALKDVGQTIDDATLGELLGYTYHENDKCWYQTDDEGKEGKVTGLMAVLADAGIDEASDKINTTQLGVILGYENRDGDWYKLDDDGNATPVDGFMSKVAEQTINTVDKVFDSLVIGDIVKEEDRKTGIFAIIDPTTPINEIGGEVNNSISNSPLQFFINNNLVTFDTDQQKTLDSICVSKGIIGSEEDAKKENSTVTLIRYSADDDIFEKYYYNIGYDWTQDNEGNYLVPVWRTKPLNESFTYIIGLLYTP